MKLTIKITSEDQLRKTINFVKELTGKDFKQVKIKNSKNKEVLNFPKLNEYFEKCRPIKEDPKVKFEKGGMDHSNDNRNIHEEGLRCHPNCVKGTLYNCNVTEGTKCNRCKQSNMYFGSASIIPNKACIDEND